MSGAEKPEARRRALGRGLESLLPSKPSAAVPVAPATVQAKGDGQPLEIDVELIERNPFQTRTVFDEEKLEELTRSVAASGVVQPVVVRLAHNQPGRYTLITGERRLMASKRAGKKTIPAVVREISNLQAMEMTIVENLQRADLNPMEQAHAFARLSRDFHMTQEQMAERTGKDRPSIGNFLRLLRLPEPVQKHIEAGELSFGHAKVLMALESDEAILAAATRIVSLHLSVRAAENMVQGMLYPEGKQKPQKVVEPKDPNVREAEERLRQALGLKVTVEDKSGKGRVIIEYAGVDDFDAILTALGSRVGM